MQLLRWNNPGARHQTSVFYGERGWISRTKTRASGGGRKMFLTSPYIDQAFTVRREKALDHSGMKGPPGNGIAPPGSNRSGGGGNEAAEASGGEGRIRRLGESAGCNVSER